MGVPKSGIMRGRCTTSTWPPVPQKPLGWHPPLKEIQTKAATPKVSVGGSARKMCFVQPVHEFSNCTLVKPNLLKNGQMGLNGLLQRENHPTISYSIWATICSYYLLDNILNYLIIFKTFQNSKHQHTIMFLKNPLEPESCSSHSNILPGVFSASHGAIAVICPPTESSSR